MRWLMLSALLGALAACSSGGVDGAGGQGGEGSGEGGGLLVSTGSGGNTAGCADEARWVYLLGKGRELVRFDPGTVTLTEIGKLNCPVAGGPNTNDNPTPFSMAVDRGGHAWVHYNDGTLYKVDVNTAQCSVSGFTPHQLSSFLRFGMGFSTNGANTQAETLYLSSFEPGDGIATLEFPSLDVKRVGFYNGGVSSAAELTGTGDGKLYGYFLANPVRISEIDKETSDIVSTVSLFDVSIGTAWAFAFWGNEFYLFSAPGGMTSRIDRLQRGAAQVEPVLDDAGLVIVGAGVSTCAPLEPPQ
ncbi:MAG: hypothetical protein R3B72_28590 [Polyangiaceae bacterium]